MSKRKRKKGTPTTRIFKSYQKAFDYYNKELFQNKLPNCVLNLSRMSRSLGFFSPKNWSKIFEKIGSVKRASEISLNPDYLKKVDTKNIYGTLVHEMCHLWQDEGKKPSPGGYHNKQWSAKMRRVGLIASDTGLKGGKGTGYAVSHYVKKNGRFEKAFETMPKECFFPWESGVLLRAPEGDLTAEEEKAKAKAKAEAKAKAKNKSKYSCSKCNVNIWGKPDLRIACLDCKNIFRMVA